MAARIALCSSSICGNSARSESVIHLSTSNLVNCRTMPPPIDNTTGNRDRHRSGAGRPEVCWAMESLLAELLEAPVRERCKRGERPRPCFEVAPPH